MKARAALRAASQAISTPELPAPTIKTRLPARLSGDRYSTVWRTSPLNSSRPGYDGKLGGQVTPFAQITPLYTAVSPLLVVTRQPSTAPSPSGSAGVTHVLKRLPPRTSN